MDDIVATAKVALDPPCSDEYECEGTRLLVRVCRELQRQSGSDPFFLGCRTASQITGLDRQTAHRRLKLLQADGVIGLVENGSKSAKKASTWRYLQAA